MNRGSVLHVDIPPHLLRPLVYRILSKKYSLNVKSDGLVSLAKFIGSNFGSDWKRSSKSLKFLEEFATIWKEQDRGLFVDEYNVQEVIKELKERSNTSETKNKPSNKITGKNKTLDTFFNNGLLDKDHLPNDEKDVDNNSRNLLENVVNINTDMIVDTGDDKEVLLPENLLEWQNYFQVFNAFHQQKFVYDYIKKQYAIDRTAQISDLSMKIGIKCTPHSLKSNLSLFRMRYYLTKDRVLRNENFQNDDTFNPLSSMIQLEKQIQQEDLALSSVTYMSITQIKNLLGRDGKNFLLLGLLKKDTSGNWSLEDPSGTITIDITEAIPTKGSYYLPGCILLVEGIYYSLGNKFKVASITHPPGERREVTLDAIGNIDLLGIHGLSNSNFISRLDKDLMIRLHYLEKQMADHKFIILGGDIFLDDITTFDALKKLFENLNKEPPVAVIFNGSFSSTPVYPSLNSKTISITTTYKNNFDMLASLLGTYENFINQSTLIFIPGPNDPWCSMVNLGTTSVWPQNSIPSTFVTRMNKTCKNIVWGSNPIRLGYLSQEIVIARDNLGSRLKRYNVIFPATEEAKREEILNLQYQLQTNEDPDMSISQLVKSKDKLPAKIQEARKIVKTILDQQHLSPFLTNIKPISWDLDHTLQLSPIPSSLIFCDVTTPMYSVTYNGCKVMNSGTFIHKRTAKYLEFIPSSRTVIEEEISF